MIYDGYSKFDVFLKIGYIFKKIFIKINKCLKITKF